MDREKDGYCGQRVGGQYDTFKRFEVPVFVVVQQKSLRADHTQNHRTTKRVSANRSPRDLLLFIESDVVRARRAIGTAALQRRWVLPYGSRIDMQYT